MSLHNTQTDFLDSLMSNELESNRLIPAHHMQIYQNNVLTNLINALRNTYPLMVKLLGDEFFDVTAIEYMKHYPSQSSNLDEYGEYFSSFLNQYEPLENLIYLRDVAEFEWISHQLYLSPNHEAMNISLLENLSEEEQAHLHFILHPASRLCKFNYPISKIIDLCQEPLDEMLEIEEHVVYLLLIRRDINISMVSLDQDDFIFLNAIAEDENLENALEEALRFNPNFELGDKLPLWIQNKTIVDCYVG